MAKFSCNYTGSVYEFTQEHDIKGMREHPDYTEVTEPVQLEQAAPKVATKKATKVEVE